MIIRRLKIIFIAMTCLAMMSACRDFESDRLVEQSVGDCYINIAIAVSGRTTHTRADEPKGGEDGDGREAGFERENTVTGITLILYQDGDGINTTADPVPVLKLVRYFPVTLGHRDTQNTEYATKTDEAYYTTGVQPLGANVLNFGAAYHAIVIANAPEVAASLTEGTSTLNDLRNKTLSTIYVGDPTKSADDCTNFVMSSEEDNTINFGSVTAKNLDGTPHVKGQDRLFDLTGQPLRIERMAARIDFHAANSNGYKTSADNAAYTIPGYEYNVSGSITDKFVVTGIVPFNLTNGHATYGIEYLLKRLRTDISDATTTQYLINETTTNYVIDPKTDDKTTIVTPPLTSPLANIYTLIGNSSYPTQPQLDNTTDNPYYHSIEAMHASSSKSTISEKENVVVCYPMENCLLPTSKLYDHATGIAIIGYYYQNGTGTGTRYVYLSYLRHQGDAATYDILPYTTPLDKAETMGATPAMKYGVVRNNIYRISINSIDKKGSMELSIKVKKWDPYIHEYIYM